MSGLTLIVDDDLDTAALFRDAMRKRGFACDSVLSAEECMAKMRALRQDPHAVPLARLAILDP